MEICWVVLRIPGLWVGTRLNSFDRLTSRLFNQAVVNMLTFSTKWFKDFVFIYFFVVLQADLGIEVEELHDLSFERHGQPSMIHYQVSISIYHTHLDPFAIVSTTVAMYSP